MARFYQFTVRDEHGRRIRGTLEASHPLDLIRNLQKNGYTVTDLEERKQAKPVFRRKIPAKELAVLCRQLHTVVRVGVPLLHGLKAIERQSKNKRLKEILTVVASDLSAGSSLAEAFAKHESYFPPLLLKMLHAAEIGGNLEPVLAILAENFRKEHLVWQKVKNSLTYPAIVFVLSMVTVTFLSFAVLPIFSRMYAETNAPLPFVTQVVLQTQQFFSQHAFSLMVASILLLLLLWKSLSSERGRKGLDRLLYHLPVSGSISKKIALFRFSQTLHDLYASGVSVDRSLPAAAEAVNHSYVAEALQKANEQVQRGKSLAAAIGETGVFPGLYVSMLQVGEETGEMETMLAEISAYCIDELEYELNRVLTLLEPVLILAVGLLVAGVIISIILPLYDGMFLITG